MWLIRTAAFFVLSGITMLTFAVVALPLLIFPLLVFGIFLGI